VFKFKLTSYDMTTVVDYEAVCSLLQLGDSKVCCCVGLFGAADVPISSLALATAKQQEQQQQQWQQRQHDGDSKGGAVWG
jgi:hypothetical protein